MGLKESNHESRDIFEDRCARSCELLSYGGSNLDPLRLSFHSSLLHQRHLAKATLLYDLQTLTSPSCHLTIRQTSQEGAGTPRKLKGLLGNKFTKKPPSPSKSPRLVRCSSTAVCAAAAHTCSLLFPHKPVRMAGVVVSDELAVHRMEHWTWLGRSCLQHTPCCATAALAR